MAERKRELISIIVPCYNEQAAIPFFYKEIDRISQVMKEETDFELLFVDDGSKDGTMAVLRELAANDKRVRYVSFSRNFGKEAAMYAGLENARGDPRGHSGCGPAGPSLPASGNVCLNQKRWLRQRRDPPLHTQRRAEAALVFRSCLL